jgi:LytR cell envelope-related transcriptional attenuator
MHIIESIGPILGIVAFVGLATLAFLLFQQARDIRRLREWAGRAPERAQEAAEAVQAVAEASRTEAEADEEKAGEEPAARRGRLAAAWARVTGPVTRALRGLDRRLPVDGRYLLAAVAVVVVVAGVATSGFGVVGGNDRKQHDHGTPKPHVAVLNGTGVSGLAALVGKQVVEAAGYKTGTVANAGSSIAKTLVLFAPGKEPQARKLAKAIKPKLGDTPTKAMTTELRSSANGAPLALGVGLDDAQFGGGSG